jgi:hypothetical protein
MLVKMKADISGSRDGKPWPRPGFTLDVPDWEARELIDQGMAEPAPAVAPVEAAVVSTEPASVTVSAGVTKASMQAATVPTRPAPVPKG